MDYLSGRKCGSDIIVSNSSCKDGVCRHSFSTNNYSLSHCSSSITTGGSGLSVRVQAVNILGKGPYSDPVTIVIPSTQLACMLTLISIPNCVCACALYHHMLIL